LEDWVRQAGQILKPRVMMNDSGSYRQRKTVLISGQTMSVFEMAGVILESTAKALNFHTFIYAKLKKGRE